MQHLATATLIIGGFNIRQDEARRYCLNDLHKVAGGEKRHLPSRWLENQQTQELIAEISNSLNIPITEITVIEKIKQLEPVNIIKSFGQSQGIYVIRELVYAYAMWISPAFHLIVIRAYDAMLTSTYTVTLPQDFNSDLRTLLNIAQAMTDAISSLVDKYSNHIPGEQIPNPTCPHLVDCEQRTQPVLRSSAPTLSLTSQAQLCADAAFLTNLWESIESQPITASELYRIILTRQYPALSDSAVELLGDVNIWTARKLGQVLGRWSRSELSCHRVLNTGTSKNGIVWRLERATN